MFHHATLFLLRSECHINHNVAPPITTARTAIMVPAVSAGENCLFVFLFAGVDGVALAESDAEVEIGGNGELEENEDVNRVAGLS